MTVRPYWWTDVPNFGDRLAADLLQFADITYVGDPYPIQDSNLVTVGSVLEHIKPEWSGIIAGAGKLYEDSKLHLDSATVLGVRGPLSAKGLSSDVVIGDPGLLADELVGFEPKRWDLGILPHWADTRLRYNHRFYGNWSTHVISPFFYTRQVILEVIQCRRLVTSSLHGLILADAIGIPRRFEPSHRTLTDEYEGGLFKFKDYAASVNVPFRVGEVQTVDRNVIDDRKCEIWDMYRSLKDRLV